MAELDHLVIGARSLADGAAFLARHLGAEPVAGGRHAGWGTHNLLLGLGPEHYIEVIAADPGQPDPGRARPFDLDDPAVREMLEAEPRLLGWVARTPALEAVVARLGASHAGEIEAMRRGDLAWRIAFPPQRQDMDNLIPALIRWDGPGGAARLPDSGWRVSGLEAEHPEAEALRQALGARGLDDALRVRQGNHPRLLARLRRADGTEAVLSSA